MSTYKSIAGATQSLATLLGDQMTEPATITIAPPDVAVDEVSGPRLNMYLYHMSENPYLKNQEIPGEGYPGAYGNPPLSLNLHYIFTAFGASDTAKDADATAQRVLGDAMRVLHDFPIISAGLKQAKSPLKPVLDTTLLDEYEQVKITLQPKSLEEISKIWTALPRVNFRRSVTYEVTVVQIESKQPRSSGLPVRQQRVYALTMKTPQIQEVFLQPPLLGIKLAAAQEGETLRLLGFNLSAPNTTVAMDGVDATISNLSNSQIDVAVPTGKLTAGTHSLNVLQKVMLTVMDGKPPVQRGGFSSNAVAFQLIPKINGAVATDPGTKIVTVAVSPAVGVRQEVFLLLGDFVIPRIAPDPLGPATTSSLTFQLPKSPAAPIPAGTYLMRVRVDGAESRLDVDTTPASATFLQYIGPNLIVT